MSAKKYLNEALTAIIRNKFLAIVTIVSIAFILLIFNILLAINQLTQESINELSDQLNVTLYLRPEFDAVQLEPLIKDLEQLPFVTETKFASATESLSKIKEKYPESASFLDEQNVANPLPATLNVYTTSLETQAKLIAVVNEEPFNKAFRVDASTNQRSTIRTVINNLIELKGFTFQIVLWVILTFTIGGSLLVFNAINVTLFSRRREIQIMQLVGATHRTIKIPFVVEGILYGAASFILSLIVLIIAYQFIPDSIDTLGDILISAQYQSTLLIELIIIAIISGTTSILTVENYLKQKGFFST